MKMFTEKPDKNMIIDLTTLSGVRRERIRKALELNMSYYGEIKAIRSVGRAYVNEEQKHWTFEFVGVDGFTHHYGLFENELKRDLGYVTVEDDKIAPETIIDTIEDQVRASYPTTFVLRDKKRPHIVTLTYLNKNRSKLVWKFVQYEDKVTLASLNFSGVHIEIDEEIKSINHAYRVANKITSEICISEGLRYA